LTASENARGYFPPHPDKRKLSACAPRGQRVWLGVDTPSKTGDFLNNTFGTEPEIVAEAKPPSEPLESCVSCGARLTGAYCAQCGEKVLSASDLDWRHYALHELPNALGHAEGKLPQTLVSLFRRPGELALAFVSGRRRVFVGPLKLYLAAFVLFTLTANFTGVPDLSLPERARQFDATHLLDRLIAARGTIAWSDPALQKRIASRTHWFGEAGTFLIYVFVALLQQVVLLRTHRRYLEHLALALNVLTFYLLVTAVVQLLFPWIFNNHTAEALGEIQTVLSLTVLPVYWYLSIRRFYRIGRPWAAAAAATITIGNALIATVLNTAIFAVLIVTS
jgi:Protein of unknown function (DUF3667)